MELQLSGDKVTDKIAINRYRNNFISLQRVFSVQQTEHILIIKTFRAVLDRQICIEE